MAFCKTEKAASDSLYQEWQNATDGEKYNHNYRALFLQMEEAIREAMKVEHCDVSKTNSDSDDNPVDKTS
jgi:CPA2 family monovalent cation:H+ antiporter-2/glutathione-regulated potassium-efflux system ancillary protein KefC